MTWSKWIRLGIAQDSDSTFPVNFQITSILLLYLHIYTVDDVLVVYNILF